MNKTSPRSNIRPATPIFTWFLPDSVRHLEKSKDTKPLDRSSCCRQARALLHSIRVFRREKDRIGQKPGKNRRGGSNITSWGHYFHASVRKNTHLCKKLCFNCRRPRAGLVVMFVCCGGPLALSANTYNTRKNVRSRYKIIRKIILWISITEFRAIVDGKALNREI